MRLKRFGTKKRPDYRIVVMDSRAKTQGRTSMRLVSTILWLRKISRLS